MTKTYHVYFLTNKYHTVLYTGVTSNIARRIWEHRQGLVKGFTKKYNCKKLVYSEEYQHIEEALTREKQIKNWSRKKKDFLVNQINPEWSDLMPFEGDPSTTLGMTEEQNLSSRAKRSVAEGSHD